MSEKRIQKIVNFIKTFLNERNIQVQKIIVFGSHALRKAAKDSDMDIAIVSANFEKKDIFERSELLKGLNWSLVKQFAIPFDILPISLSEWSRSSSIAVSFVKEGKIMYAHN